MDQGKKETPENGIKRSTSICGSLFIFFLLSVFCFPVISFSQGSNIEFGKKFFGGKCARCHGKDGSGNPKMTHLLNTPLNKINLRRVEVQSMSVIQIEEKIDSGNHRMPKYRGKLTDSQIHDIAAYVKTFGVNELSKEKPKN
jgi:mono/diheme cytochrome c family protein